MKDTTVTNKIYTSINVWWHNASIDPSETEISTPTNTVIYDDANAVLNIYSVPPTYLVKKM